MTTRRTGRTSVRVAGGAYHAGVSDLAANPLSERAAPGVPPAPVGELALPPLVADKTFAAFAERASREVARARVSEPILPLVAAALWRARQGHERPALAIVVEDDESAHNLA